MSKKEEDEIPDIEELRAIKNRPRTIDYKALKRAAKAARPIAERMAREIELYGR